MMNTFDELLLELGNPGKFRILLFVLLACNIFPVSLNSYSILFSAIVPKHRCRIPENSSWALNESLPTELIQENSRFRSCEMWIDPDNTSLGMSDCIHGYHYDVKEGENFVSMEFDLVCDRAYIVSIGLSLAYFGRVVGGLSSGFISDYYGRRKSILISMVINCSSSILAGFVQSPYLFYAVIFLLSFSIQSLQSGSYSASSELFHPNQRTVPGILISLPWSIGIMTVAILFWWLKNWRHVQMLIGFSTIIAFIYNWFVPESIRWHVARGEVDEAFKICEKFKRFNNQPMPPNFKDDLRKISESIIESQTKSSKGNFLDLFKSPNIRKYTFILGFAYFTALLMYLSIAFAIPKLGGNKYLSYAMLGAFEIGMRFVASYVYQRFGRRKPLAISLSITSFFAASAAVIRFWKSGGIITEYISIGLAISGNIILIASFSGIGLSCTEVYPTLIRAIGIGFCVTFGRMGAILAPQLMLLESFWEPLPILLASALGLISGISCFFLPETNLKSLPDSVGDASGLQKDRKKVG